jgi:tRNA(adenine34) deaminase
VYGARNLERGCINLKTKLHPKTTIIGGVLADEAATLMKRFFVEKRNLN